MWCNIWEGVVAIPKSVTPERIIHNADIFDFELSPEDMVKIDHLDKFACTETRPWQLQFLASYSAYQSILSHNQNNKN